MVIFDWVPVGVRMLATIFLNSSISDSVVRKDFRRSISKLCQHFDSKSSSTHDILIFYRKVTHDIYRKVSSNRKFERLNVK